MQIAVLYLSTAAVFLILDAIMLTLVMKPLFDRHIGALMLENIRLLSGGAVLPRLCGGAFVPRVLAGPEDRCAGADPRR